MGSYHYVMSKYETWDEWKRAVGFTPSAPEPERTGVSSIDQEIAGLANSLDALYAELDDLDNERAILRKAALKLFVTGQ